MTCVVGIVSGRSVIMGADSAGAAEYYTLERKDEKVFRNGPFLMGFTDSFRMGQLLRYAFTPPERHVDEELERFMVTRFIDGVRQTLKAGGFAAREREQESGGHFLVGYQGRLFQIEGDYQVGENGHGYAAVGCGRELAMGALHATQGLAGARDRVRLALAAAAQFSAFVRPPFVVLEG